MNDEDIKKALECCLDVDAEACSACPISKVRDCNVQLFEEIKLYFEQQAEIEQLKSLCTSKDVIINEQEAEIERLQNEIKGFDNFLKETDCSLKEIKDNAIKEFAEKLKSTYRIKERYCDNTKFVIRTFRNSIDSLLAEMVGGENEKSN